MNPKTSLQKSLFPRFSLKAISLFTVIVFLSTSFSSLALAQSQDYRLQTTDQSLGMQSQVSSLQSEFVIPPELGTIVEREYGVRSTAKESRVTPYALRRTVVLIQDAHAVPDAQRSLEKLIEYLQEKYGVTTVALEGAEGKLDATLFHLFPDAKKREEVFGEHLGSGELSGAAVASVLSSRKADYVGIEDWKLYQEGVAAFLNGLKSQPAIDAQLVTLNEELKKLK